MQPKTSVRQPVIAGARRQHLSELLRKWRRQPRKRSPLLFWTLLSLALLSDSGLLYFTARLSGVWESESSAEGTAFWERLLPESQPFEYAPARPVLYLSLLTVFFFTAAAVVKLRWPLWRRRLLLMGLLSGLGCVGWSAAVLGQPIRDGLPPIYDGCQGMLWSASVILGLGLLLAALYRDAFLAFVAALASTIGYAAAIHWPLAFAEPWPTLPTGTADDGCMRVQVLILLSAYAALALAWTIAAFTLVRVLLDAPGSERLRRLAMLCLWPIRLAVILLAVSALLDGWRTLAPGSTWQGWNAQALGTLLVLPGCAALVYAQRRAGMSAFRLLMCVVLGLTFLAAMWQSAVRWGTGDLHLGSAVAVDVASCMAGLLSLSLASHAALRYYFGRQRILEV
jgi:hypothetical protein